MSEDQLKAINTEWTQELRARAGMINQLEAKIDRLKAESADWQARFEATAKSLEAAMKDFYTAQGQPEDALIFERPEHGPIVPGVVIAQKTRPPLIIDDPGVTFRSGRAIQRWKAMERVCKALLAQGHPCPSKGLWDALAALEALK